MTRLVFPELFNLTGKIQQYLILQDYDMKVLVYDTAYEERVVNPLLSFIKRELKKRSGYRIQSNLEINLLSQVDIGFVKRVKKSSGIDINANRLLYTFENMYSKSENEYTLSFILANFEDVELIKTLFGFEPPFDDKYLIHISSFNTIVNSRKKDIDFFKDLKIEIHTREYVGSLDFYDGRDSITVNGDKRLFYYDLKKVLKMAGIRYDLISHGVMK